MDERTPVIEKAFEKLKEKKIKLSCPTCGGQPNWNILGDPVSPLFLDNELKECILQKGCGLIMLSCGECGFTVFHSLEILLKEK